MYHQINVQYDVSNTLYFLSYCVVPSLSTSNIPSDVPSDVPSNGKFSSLLFSSLLFCSALFCSCQRRSRENFKKLVSAVDKSASARRLMSKLNCQLGKFLFAAVKMVRGAAEMQKGLN